MQTIPEDSNPIEPQNPNIDPPSSNISPIIELDKSNSVDLDSQKGLKPWMIYVMVFVVGIIGLTILFFSTDKTALKSNNKTEVISEIPATTENSQSSDIEEPEQQLETPTPSPLKSPTPTPKPSVKTSPSPSPTPTVIVDNSFTCGIYSKNSYPPLPAIGGAPLYVTLFPSMGTNGGINLVGAEWDFDGDGVWEGGVSESKVGRTYDKSGTFTAKFRAKGSNGAVGPTCTYPHQIVVGSGLAAQNDLISVDKTNVEVTISKSKVNYTFPEHLDRLNNIDYLIYMPFITISSKKQGTGVIVEYPGTSPKDYGITTGASYMDPGTSWPIQIWVAKTLSNGTYSGEVLIQTNDDSGLIKKLLTTVTYKITLTD